MSLVDNMDKAISFLDKKVDIDFCDSTTLHDRVLLAEGKKFYVISMYLAMHSEYFYGLFNTTFKEKDQSEIPLKEVDANTFEVFLKILHHQEIKVNRENLANLIRLSNMFLAPIIWQKCVELLKQPGASSYFQLDELFELLNLPGSDGLRPIVEDRCMDIFLRGYKLSEFLKIVEEYKFDRLMESIFREISSKVSYPGPDIIELLLKNTEFDKFKDVFEERYSNGRIEDTVALLHVIIMLSKYDLPDLQAFVNYYFFVKQPSAEVIQQLINRIQNLSTERRSAFEEMVHNSAKYLAMSPHIYSDIQGMGNMLLEFSYLFLDSCSEYTITQAHKLVKSFLYNFQISDVKEFFDAKWALTFATPYDFKYIKFVLEQNLTQLKMEMEKWLTSADQKEVIKKGVSLLRHMGESEMVYTFALDSLKKNPDGREILRKFKMWTHPTYGRMYRDIHLNYL